MQNIVILISGRGSNMQAIVKANIPGAQIAAVVSNHPQAAGLTWAQERGLVTATLDHKTFASREAFDQALIDLIDSYQANWVVLAGFMRILSPEFTRHYAGRLINIHPSLLPAFPGLNTHQRAIDAGCKVAGCTIHFVTEALDHGPIIAQGVVPVLDNDTEEQLAKRVLTVEHQLYPEALRRLVAGKLILENGKVHGMPAYLQSG